MKSPDTLYTNPQQHLSQGQLIRYDQDRMDDAEMHRAERHLLDCTLCSDALEGISMLQPQQTEASLENLKSRLSARLEREGPAFSPYRLWAAAAAVLLLAVSALWWLNHNFTGDLPQAAPRIVQQEPRAAEDAPPRLSLDESSSSPDAEKQETPTDSAPEAAKGTQQHGMQSEQENATPPQPPGPVQEIAASEKVAPKLAKELIPASKNEDYIIEELIFKEEAEIENLAEAENSRDTLPPAEKAGPGQPEASPINIAGSRHYTADRNNSSGHVAGRSRVQSSPKALKGKITDQYGEPLPGVSVRIKDSNQGTVTDLDGTYSLQLPAGDAALLISFIGYVDKEVAVKDSDTMLVAVLEEEVHSLSEVVVVGYGSQQSAEVADPPTTLPPRPEGGRRAYKKYLKKEQRYPAEALEAGIEGAVVLEFNVEPGGSLSNFRIRKSQGYGLDEEAIRLIKEGPAWQPATTGDLPVRHKVRVRVRFKLP